jgi:hypothetical protein
MCAKKSSTSSIECYNQISEQDQTPLNTNTTVKKYFLEILHPPPVPLPKITSFDAARRALSIDMSKIVISKTNVDIKFGKILKQALKEIFHLPIRSECVPHAKHILDINKF